MEKQEIVDFLTNVADSQFQQAATDRAILAKKRKEAQGLLKEEYTAKKKSILSSLIKNVDFKWFLENEILPFTIPAPLFTADLDGRAKYDILRADIYRNLFSDIMDNVRRE